jgi:hypothetical protein
MEVAPKPAHASCASSARHASWLVAAIVAGGCGRVAFEPGMLPADGDASTDSSNDTLDQGLQLHVPFDGDLTERAVGAALLCASCPSFEPGRLGMAARFAAPACVVTPGGRDGLKSQTFTLATWFSSARSARTALFGKLRDPVATDDNSWQLWLQDDDRIAFTMVGAQFNIHLFGPVHEVGRWHHIAASFDGVTKRLYLDGIEVASAAALETRYDDSSVTLGCDRNVGVEDHHFDGLLDDVRVYDRVLTPIEIATLAR